MRLLLSGYYGFGNLGDEAILDVIVERVRARFPQARIDVLSATPQVTAVRLGVEATPRWEMRAVRAAVARADVVVSGGGGLLQNATSLRSLLYYAGIIREGVRRGRKTMIFAQSVGPLDRLGATLVSRLCKGVDRATVRDARSAALLASLLPQTPVERTADPVFLYEPPQSDDLSLEGLGPGARPYAIVSVRECPALAASLSTIAALVDRLATAHGTRVAFLPIGGAQDASAATSVIRACKSAPMLLPEPALERAAAILAGASYVAGMRLHALILAARAAVPFLAIPYDPKVDALLQELAYPLAPLRMVRRGEALPDAQAAADEFVARAPELHAHLDGQRERVRALAERNFAVLAELME
jgi:polysaccharide pyruvyl transferase CsaB